MFGGGNSYANGNSMSNGNSFGEARGWWDLEPTLIYPDPWRRMP